MDKKIIIIAVVLILACAVLFVATQTTETTPGIYSFDDCAKVYPVMESYPERCCVPDGDCFTNPRQQVEPPTPPLGDIKKADDSKATQEGINAVVTANNEFAIEFYNNITAEDDGNVFFSPWSLESALSMTYEGAKGQTATELQAVLRVPVDPEIRKPAFAAIMNNLNPQDAGYMLSTANALWAEPTFTFLEDYFDTVQNYYLGGVTNLDFMGDIEGSRQTINTWVEDNTNDKIKDLIPQGMLSPDTKLVLTNAVHFKGDWAIQFKEENTREGEFRTPDGTIQTDMMNLYDESFSYMENDDMQLLEMPYEGEELSMVILLPKTDSLDDLEASLTIGNLNTWLSSTWNADPIITMPKFKFETKYFLAKKLAQMGMPTAFTGAADFSGISGGKDLFIDEVIHQAYVDVNEEGTEAAAATAIIMKITAIMEPLRFTADHPFIFLIRDMESGQILFMGRVMDPTA